MTFFCYWLRCLCRNQCSACWSSVSVRYCDWPNSGYRFQVNITPFQCVLVFRIHVLSLMVGFPITVSITDVTHTHCSKISCFLMFHWKMEGVYPSPSPITADDHAWRKKHFCHYAYQHTSIPSSLSTFPLRDWASIRSVSNASGSHFTHMNCKAKVLYFSITCGCFGFTGDAT